MPADVLRRHERAPVAGSPGVGVDARQRTRRGEERCESIVCFGWPMRPLRVHVPAVPDRDLSGVHRITDSSTVYL
jgi:hypothetical protein